MDPMHKGINRRDPKDLYSIYDLEPTLLQPSPEAIVVFDDLLTSGCHFRAMEQKIKESFPDVPCYGIFIGRSII